MTSAAGAERSLNSLGSALVIGTHLSASIIEELIS